MKEITVEITQHDVDILRDLVNGFHVSFSWQYDGVTITFVKGDEEE